MSYLKMRMLEDMQIRNLSIGTQKQYLNAVKQFAEHYWKNPIELNEFHVRDYLIKAGTIHKAYTAKSALRFLYQQTLKKNGKFLIFLIRSYKKSF